MFAITRALVRPNLVSSVVLRPPVTSSLAATQMMRTSQPAQAQVQMKIVPAKTAITREGYEEKNERIGREMSPFLTIYKPQLTSMLSITHRGTGMVLGMYAYALGMFALVSSKEISYYIEAFEDMQLAPAVVLAVKFILAFPFGYHAANGIRHLLWDSGRFLTIKQVYSTGYAMLALAFIITAGLCAL